MILLRHVSVIFFFSDFSALQRERQLSSQLRDTLDEERTSQSEFSAREKAAIADMQVQPSCNNDHTDIKWFRYSSIFQFFSP